MNWFEVTVVLGLILVNGFFSASELALVSARKARLRALADRGERGARIALQLLEDPTRLLSSVQIGITLVGIFTGVYSGATFADALAGVFRGVPWIAPYAQEAAFAVVVSCVTYLSLVFGELVPKRLALAHAERFAIFVSRPMLWIAHFGAPLVWLLQVSTEAAAKLLPFAASAHASVTEDEVRALVAAGAKEGVFQRSEKDMIEGVLRLADRSIESVMVPRGDIMWLDSNAPVEELWAEARASGHARFLLCDGELERLTGVITLADLGEALRLGQRDLTSFLRTPKHVPSTVSLLRLLELFQVSTTHLAIVTDEYGGIEGLVTPADILRAIAGGLSEMGSRERADAARRDDGSWLVDGHLSIHDAERLLERRDLLHDDDYHTVAGFVLWHLGHVPVPGEKLAWRDLRIEVMDMDGPRIDKVLIAARREPERDAEDGAPISEKPNAKE
jgi:putative hemolysin